MKKKLIRNDVFETNSSSCHSVSINKCDTNLYSRLYPNEDGIIELTGGEFGWGYDHFTDALTKANYVAVSILLLEKAAGDYNTADDDRKRIFSGYTLPLFGARNALAAKMIFEKVIRNQTGSEVVYNFSVSDWDHPNHSYIDHQSFEDARDAEWLLSEENVFDFIFSPNSELVIDNDNH